jgi:ribosomal protein S16
VGADVHSGFKHQSQASRLQRPTARQLQRDNHGCHSTCPGRRQEASVLQYRGHRFAQSRDGRFIERVGFYNPVAAENEPKLRIAADRLTYWTGVGARMSPTVARLVKEHAPATA